MVSAAEQLASNLNFSALAKAGELKQRLWFTLGALIVYRLGTYIPLPGIDPSAWEQIFRTQSGGILGMLTCSPAVEFTGWRSSPSTSCRTSRLRSSFS
jgi:preprotein translocase subunit SecY